jgi:hypothetical protein
MNCGSEKLRSLVKEYFGEEELDHYDEMVDQCKLGQALKDDRVWAPLCPDYPNLKGVTCDEIDKFVDTKSYTFFTTAKYDQIKDDALAVPSDVYDPARIDRLVELLRAMTTPEDFAKHYDENKIYRSTHDIITDIEKQVAADKPSDMTFTEDYFHHVKVYDRDEAYSAFKKVGAQIEEDMPGTLHDPSTIFVTTPRGGHEMLSMFAYANDIKKENVPSDITWEHIVREEEKYGTGIIEEKHIRKKHVGIAPEDVFHTKIFGKTWLGNKSDNVKQIFIVDDIIASAMQVKRTNDELREMFPDAEIYSVVLCKREDVNIAKDDPNPSYNPIEKCYYDTETSGIDKFREARTKNELFNKEYITCSFQHACPDGTSDQLMNELMGDKRCSPEKRISKRDL